MKVSKNEVVSAILLFAEKYGQKPNYEALFAANIGLERIVQMIVYEMFLEDFPLQLKLGIESKSEYEAYLLIVEFGKELKTNGFIEYEK